MTRQEWIDGFTDYIRKCVSSLTLEDATNIAIAWHDEVLDGNSGDTTPEEAVDDELSNWDD